MNTNQTPSETKIVANRLCELCSAGEWDRALNELYAENARHVEAMTMPGSPWGRITEGKANLKKMSEEWNKTTTVHSAKIGKPLVNGDQFLVEMALDCTSTAGPMAGQRVTMSEQALYTVKNGQITEAKFFYGGCD
jgi:ketosteroid isomerase-like protein